MSKKLFVFDLDGTLLNTSKTILESSHRALDRIREAGHEVAVATGRNYAMAKMPIEESLIDHYIVCNGSAAYKDGKQFYINPLDKDEMYQLLETALKENHSLVYETPDKLYRHHEKVTDRVENGMAYVSQPVPEQNSDFYTNDDIVQLLLFVNDDELEKYYQNRFKQLKFVRWYKDAVDVIPTEGSKWESVQRLADELGIPHDRVVTFGDGNNDYEMIANAKYGVAMGNAHDHIKKAARYVTDDNDSDGILNILDKANLL